MGKLYNFFVVDDDPIAVKLMESFLVTKGHRLSASYPNQNIVDEIVEEKPDCVLLDIMMPGIDGIEILRRLRAKPELNSIKVVIVSGKSYEFDRRRAFSLGADGYFIKPVDPRKFVSDLEKIVEDKIRLTFWGVHGTLPVPGKKYIRYGGNTSCLTLEFPRGIFFIFDAGTGIKVLSDHLMAQKILYSQSKIFISHPHWDHINALPFFAPLYIQGNEFEILGPMQGDKTMRELISGQMEGVYFPINLKEFSARVYFRDLREEAFEIDNIKIKSLLLNHPGYCLGYRIEYKDRKICYVTDNEIYPKTSKFHNEDYYQKFTDFIFSADALIIDCTYTDKEYEKKMCWGHSALKQVVDIAAFSKVKNLYLYHHDPEHTDDDIDIKVRDAEIMLTEKSSQTKCLAPKEGQVFEV
ncbi:MAG: response regulator [Desulfobacterales bacterium]|nr:response regulator [Desulfobacterales bacterium]